MANASQGVIELLRNPSQLQDLKSDPSLSTAYVEELCRYHTGSSMAMKRVAKEDIVLGGKVGLPFLCRANFMRNLETEMKQAIKAGEGIIAANASGNRDEEVFSDPNVFNMHRTPDPNHALGFGFGPHRCIAEPLARAEMELVFGKHAFLGNSPELSAPDVHVLRLPCSTLPPALLSLPSPWQCLPAGWQSWRHEACNADD